MSAPRVIIYALPDEMILAARVAKALMADDYVWPSGGVTIFAYGDLGFAARKNKSGFTIYSQQMRA